ncbi:hypothetical protein B7486_04335 [cyanobacterium TDX16]|nr:hypothetical protein B7486_04335 [cyanobacterium TDX16]
MHDREYDEMTMHSVFTPRDTWHGGYFELAIELGPRSDDRLTAAVEHLWNSSQLKGCWIDSNREPSEGTRIAKNRSEIILNEEHLYGIAMLDDGKNVACGCCAVREDGGIDWLVFYLPMGALARAYQNVGEYPFSRVGKRHNDTWVAPIEKWLERLGRFLFEKVDFRLALIGFEVSGSEYADQLEKNGMPEKRWNCYLWRVVGELVWYGRTEDERPFGVGA